MNNKTTITVAHRFETIKNSERINVLEAGKIVEQGTYEDLLKKRGYFYNLSKGH
jgi:ABC-type multidrug transport system fused ATPase/permease subunit